MISNHDVYLLRRLLVLLLIIEIVIVEVFIHKKNKRNEKEKNINDSKKNCKYCMSEINANATVCPNCKRGLSFKTNTGVLVLLLIIVCFLIWGIFSNNSPLFIRKTVCGLGIRNDFPYCYYIDFNK